MKRWIAMCLSVMLLTSMFASTVCAEGAAEIPKEFVAQETPGETLEIAISINDHIYYGVYTGDVQDGVPHGYGRFEGAADGKALVYEGEWQAGSFHGQGTAVWQSDDHAPQAGTYTEGAYTPEWPEFVSYMGAKEEPFFTVSQERMAFLEEYRDYFTSGPDMPALADGMVDDEFDLEAFYYDADSQPAKLIYIPAAEVIQCFARTSFGVEYEYMLLKTPDGVVYYGFRPGRSNIVPEMQVEAYILPLAGSIYTSIYEKKIWTICCAVTSFIRESYPTLEYDDWGDSVLKMKFRLQDLGYFSATAKVDNAFNSVCVKTVMRFQEVNGLPVTGIADNETQQVLYSDRALPNQE